MIALTYQVRYQKKYRNRVRRTIKVFVEPDTKKAVILKKIKEDIANYGEKIRLDQVKIIEAKLVMEEEVPKEVICGY